jgi:glycosyltransferase involved in cell wall biosynthesis
VLGARASSIAGKPAGSERLVPHPRILYITSHWPGAAAYGTQQRVFQIGRLLQRIGRVSLLVVDQFGEARRWREPTEREFEIARVIPVSPANSRGLFARLRHTLHVRYLPIAPITVDCDDRQAVLRLLQEHDVVWLHGLNIANSLGIDHWPRSVIDLDDVPSRVYRSMAGVHTTVVQRLVDLRMSTVWRRREAKLADQFATILVCSDDDRRYLGLPRVGVLPNGFERIVAVDPQPIEPPRIGYIGTFKYWPNVDGVQWFCREVWRLIKQSMPNARLRLIGEASDMARSWGIDVEPLGRIDDVGPEISTWSAMIVPVRAGGGTRIKVLEAFARRCPAVATTLGAFGYSVCDGEELFVCDEPEVFASRCIELVRSPERARAMADRAHRRFLQSWTWDSYSAIVEGAVTEAARFGDDGHDAKGSGCSRRGSR